MEKDEQYYIDLIKDIKRKRKKNKGFWDIPSSPKGRNNKPFPIEFTIKFSFNSM